jgi:hypothetical protein
MQACWLAGAIRLVERRAAAGPMPLFWLLGGVPLAFTLWRRSAALPRWRRRALRFSGLLLWALALLEASVPEPVAAAAGSTWAALPRELLRFQGAPSLSQWVLLAAVLCGACGARLAFKTIDLDSVLSEFQFGLLTLVILFFCAAQWDIPIPQAVPLAFTACFLIAAAAARAETTAQKWLAGIDGRGRILIVSGHTLLVLFLGVLLSAVITPQILNTVLDLLKAVWNAALEMIARLMAFLAALLPQPQIAALPPGPGGMPSPAEPGRIPDLLRIPDLVRKVAQWFVGLFWLGLVSLSLWRLATQLAAWLRQRASGGQRAQVTAMPGAMREDLRRLFRRMRDALTTMWRRLRRRRSNAPMAAGAEAARQLYRRMLRWSAASGCRRRPHRTPREFLGELCAWLPEGRAEFDLITRVYERVRYGGLTPQAETLTALAQAWQTVRKKKKRGQGKRIHAE